MNTPGSSFSHSLHPFPGPLTPTHGAELTVPAVDASVVWGVLSVRGPLLTVRSGETLWVLRAGADPRAWKKPLDRHGNSLVPWEPARPPLNELLRVPAAFPPTAGTIIEECRRSLDLPADWSEEVREARAGGWAARSREEWDEDDQTCEGIPFQVGHYKGTSPFPWSWVPGEGERRMRRQAPDPESIGWYGERPPSEREWKRIPPGGSLLEVREPPTSLSNSTYVRLRSAIRRTRLLRRDLPDWAALFPDGAMDFVERHRFSNRRWHLINLWLRVPGGRELWDDIPALAWLAASSWLCKTKPVKRPFRSLRALVKKPRACLLRWLDLPAGGGSLTLLRSIKPSLMNPKFAHALCRVLRDEDKRRAWRNLPRPISGVELRLLAYDLPISFPILRLINEGKGVGHALRRQPAKRVYVDCLKMIRTLEGDADFRPALARVQSGERLVAFHDELVRDLGGFERLFQMQRGERIDRAGLDHPPVPAPIPPAPGMHPLGTWSELQAEGRWMRHCLAGYDREVAGGGFYAYAILHPRWGRATLGIRKSLGRKWQIADLRGRMNEEVCEELEVWVEDWLETANQASNRPGPDLMVTPAGSLNAEAQARPEWIGLDDVGTPVALHFPPEFEVDPLIDEALQLFRTRLIKERAERNGQDKGNEGTGMLEEQDRSDWGDDIPF